MRLIDVDSLISNVKQKMDMQDLYLPIHFLELIEEEISMEEKNESDTDD